jgi:SAM-dependent methyltransferase
MPATMSTRDRDALAEISRRTVAHYEADPQGFWEGTRDHDVSQNQSALLDALAGRGPLAILDLGCGPGRDLARFRSLGHEAVGLDACPSFVRMARELSGCEVWAQDFLALSLPPARFHGIFANASLFHVPSQELPRVLAELHTALKPAGVLFASNPRGNGQEGFQGERYGHFIDLPGWHSYLTGAGFELVHHYYRPEGRPRSQQPWLAIVARRV